MLTMQFNTPKSSDEVRNRLTQAFGSEITLEELRVSADPSAGTATQTAVPQTTESRFRVRTTEQNELKVRETVNKTFQDELKKVELLSHTVRPGSRPPRKRKQRRRGKVRTRKTKRLYRVPKAEIPM
jgi:hypothetical protein